MKKKNIKKRKREKKSWDLELKHVPDQLLHYSHFSTKYYLKRYYKELGFDKCSLSRKSKHSHYIRTRPKAKQN